MLILSPKKLATVLTAIVVGLIVCHVTTKWFKYFGGYDLWGLVRLFDVDRENNLPSWYASSSLLLCSLFLAVIGLVKKRGREPYVFHWLALSAIFLYISIDEAASIHEMAIEPIRHTIPRYTSGYLYYAWVIPGSFFVLTVFAMCLRFLAHLPPPTRHLFLVAGALYVVGGLGVEMIGAKYETLYGMDTFVYSLIVATEEGLEMFGVVTFLYALSSYMSDHMKKVVLLVTDEVPEWLPAMPKPLPAVSDSLPVNICSSEKTSPASSTKHHIQ